MRFFGAHGEAYCCADGDGEEDGGGGLAEEDGGEREEGDMGRHGEYDGGERDVYRVVELMLSLPREVLPVVLSRDMYPRFGGSNALTAGAEDVPSRRPQLRLLTLPLRLYMYPANFTL